MLSQQSFERILDQVAEKLTTEMREQPEKQCFSAALNYEQHVRELLHDAIVKTGDTDHAVALHPAGQTFPDISAGIYGVEVKFTKNNTWVSIANSIRESQRDEKVKKVYLMFGKLGHSESAPAETRWKPYEDCVVHVRTSHEPRFQVDMSGEKKSLFKVMGIQYDDFRKLDIMDKMPYIRKYAKSIHPDGRLWWLEDNDGAEEHSTPISAVLYTSLDDATKLRLRAEATLLCPEILQSGRVRNKYNNAVLFLLTYHGVLCHQARDLFSAGSVAGVSRSDGSGEPQVKKALENPDFQQAMLDAARYLDAGLFKEYWGVSVPAGERIDWWLQTADTYAQQWVPSEVLFPDR